MAVGGARRRASSGKEGSLAEDLQDLKLREVILHAAFMRRLNFRTMAHWDFDHKDVLERGGIYTMKDLCALTDKEWHRLPISAGLRKQLTAFKEGKEEEVLRSLRDFHLKRQLASQDQPA